MNNVTDDDKCNVNYTDIGTGMNQTVVNINNPDNRNMFKSMPNLSASTENLLQK